MDFIQLAARYIAIFLLLVALQPPGMFNEAGCPRSFGVADGQTLLPAWLVSLAIALQMTRSAARI